MTPIRGSAAGVASTSATMPFWYRKYSWPSAAMTAAEPVPAPRTRATDDLPGRELDADREPAALAVAAVDVVADQHEAAVVALERSAVEEVALRRRHAALPPAGASSSSTEPVS